MPPHGGAYRPRIPETALDIGSVRIGGVGAGGAGAAGSGAWPGNGGGGGLSGSGGGGEGGGGGGGGGGGSDLHGGRYNPPIPLQPVSLSTASTVVASATASPTPSPSATLSSAAGPGPALVKAPQIPHFNQGQYQHQQYQHQQYQQQQQQQPFLPASLPQPPPWQPYASQLPFKYPTAVQQQPVPVVAMAAAPGPAGAGYPYQAGEPKLPIQSTQEVGSSTDLVIEPVQTFTNPSEHDSRVVGDGNTHDVNQILATGQKYEDDGRKEFPVRIKSYAFNVGGLIHRWKRPHHYKPPGFRYVDATVDQPKYRHRDAAGRVTEHQLSDRYIHPGDGALRNMHVQAVDDIFMGPDNSTWRRTWIRKVSPWQVRLATWVLDFSYDPSSWQDWGVMLARSFPIAVAMSLVFWHGEPARWVFGGNYEPVWYRYRKDAKVWANYIENENGSPATAAVALSHAARSSDVYRVLKPRHLCFLREPFDDRLHGADARSVDQWEADEEGKGSALAYVFVAYSTAHFNHHDEADMDALHTIAEAAARTAKVGAYWVAASCMRDEASLEADVYRISDVLRGAHSMVIAVGRSNTQPSASKGSPPSIDGLLAEWGRRMWTFPEVLLSPGRTINIYSRGGSLTAPMVLAKNQFAGRVWASFDAAESRQLVDHYLGNLGLSRLELAVTALGCLFRRETAEHLPGDQAYALMGLLRMRPQIDRTDTPFQAFARLSLANDSDKLLERYICTLPRHPLQDWHDMSDQYGSALWDIEPYGQVAGICEGDNAIILDGARAASIRWKSFYRPWFETGASWKRFFAMQLMNYQLVVLIVMAALFSIGQVAAGVVLLIIWLAIFLNTPTLVRLEYSGKFVYSQASLFGFEGYMNAATIERAIYGGSFGRFEWSASGSPLSRAHVNKYGEKVGLDPTKDPNIRIKVEQAKHAQPGQMRIFTLVDTYNMEIVLFEAIRPPTVLLCIASEGGMQRAVACSYDWTTSTMYRETVLRMPTASLNRMSRIARVRFGIRREEKPSARLNNFPQVETV